MQNINPFEELLLKMQLWQHLGRGKVENHRVVAYGEIDQRRPSLPGWIHSYYKPLELNEIQEAELQHNIKFPEQLVQFYLMFSCVEFFQDLFHIRGFWSKRYDPPTMSFHSIQSANQSIGYYQTETGMFIGITRHHYDKLGWIHLDFETGEVDLYLRPSGGEFTLEKSYGSLATFVFEMYDHFDKLFDKETGWRIGKLICEP